jgi:aryl-alcohol dehydrogenase-like predicted oxidoreductase
MQYMQMGRTDLTVSRICFGCWQMSPKFWGNIDVDAWQNAVLKAVDVGVNFIDTADAYGDGGAESALGDLLAKEGLRDRFIIATKFYWNFEQEGRVPDTSYEYILRECDASLRRLKTDRIDLYQIHAWDALTRPDEVAAAFGQLKKLGKVRWFGVSNLNADQIRMYANYFDVECLQPIYNLVTRDVEAHELPLCLEKRMGVIAYSPLASGLLSGKHKPGEAIADWRAELPLFKEKALGRILAGIEEMKPIADRLGLTIPQLAIRWTLTHPAMTSAIVGVKKPEHIETIVSAADANLSIRDWHRMAGIMSAAKNEALGQSK